MIDTKALRSRVLDLAIRGKLTEQLPSDGTAEELYQQIQAEKQKLIKEGKLKKEKPLPAIKDEEIPFEIPGNWKWVRFGDLMWNRDSERIPVSVADRRKLKKIYDYYGASGVIDKVETYLFDEKLLLIGEDGANLLSRSTPIAFLAEGKYWVNNHAHVLGFYVADYLDFVMHYINSISLVPYVTGSAQPKLNQDNMNKIPVPLPPLAEQKRIVERVEEIFRLLDAIDQAQEKYAEDAQILKAKLITAGIQGKLTEQLPSDGTAEELYQQIQAEKQKLIKEGKLKKEKPLPAIKDEEIPFEIPGNWKWVRFGDLMWNRDSERIPVSVADRRKLKKIYDYYGASGVIDKVETYLFDEKLLLIGEDGANLLSRSTPIAFLAEGKYWVNNHAHVLGFYVADYLDFVMHYINSISLVPYVTGSAQPKLNQDNMNKIPVPLPPLAEQKRIVEVLERVLGALSLQ